MNSLQERHKYEYRLDINSPSAPAAVVRMVGKSKRVLEIGAGPGSITRVLREYNGCCVTAIELDEEAIKKLSPFCEHVYKSDLNDPSWTSVLSNDEKFDVVVAADVLEHLRDPFTTLSAVKDVLASDGNVVVSLPHIGHNAAIGCLLQDGLKLQDWGLLDKTHIQFFDLGNMQLLLNETGFEIIDAQFIVIPPEETELAYFWRRTPEGLRKSLMANRSGMVYQVVVKAKSHLSTRQGLMLSSLPIPAPEPTTPRNATFGAKCLFAIKRRVLPYLHPHTRFWLRNFLYKAGIRL